MYSMYSFTCRASKSFDSQSKVESSNTENFEGGLCTASHNHTLDICRIVCTRSTRSPDYCAKPHEAIKLQFLTLWRRRILQLRMLFTSKNKSDVYLKGQMIQCFLRENINSDRTKTRQVRVNSKHVCAYVL